MRLSGAISLIAPDIRDFKGSVVSSVSSAFKRHCDPELRSSGAEELDIILNVLGREQRVSPFATVY